MTTVDIFLLGLWAIICGLYLYVIFSYWERVKPLMEE